MSAIPMLARLAEWRNQTPLDVAAEEGDTVWTTTELLRQAEQTAGQLSAIGVRPGDRVAWHGGSSLEFASVLLATWRLDATYVGINPRYTDREVQDVLLRTAPRVVLTPQGVSDLRQQVAAEGRSTALAETRGDHPAVLVFTTGSTGRPKIAVISHRAIAAASAIQAAHTMSGARRTINALPANHIGGLVNITTSSWWGRQAVDFVPVFSPDTIAARLQRATQVRLAAVPMLFRRCLDTPSFVAAAPGRLVHALSGGAPLPRSVHDALRALDVEVQGMYGQSEVAGSVCFTAPGDDAATTCDTVGRPPAGVSLRLGPLDGMPGDLDEGEVQVRGAQLFDGYLDDAEATRAAFTSDGWLRTGDIAIRRADGAIRLTGRLKEIINTGGHKVMPAEVEAVLQAHPKVAAAAVIGTPDPAFGEVVSAVVVAQGGDPLEVPELERWCREELANYKVPKRWVQLEALPLLGVGKVDRRALAQHFPGPSHD